ncbi:lysozyme inhibitor LprI family protein [Evansella halocellulosilytica]|uniref:lysozyme inhibitor LprI family protein n=1 Tax=Evansella halocellulosilytica TaxID=2011013 RepID=UPI000BB85A8E|nr:lysozyme inhibitor LprI family protein [Evansella halocellulosilytica]
MKNNSETLMVMFSIVFVILLAACENSSQNANDDSSNVESTENALNTDNVDTDTINADNNDTNEKVDTSNNVPKKDEEPSTNNTEARFKGEYLKKLIGTKKETEELEAVDSSTYALKKVENDRWDIWDELLNEIYGALDEQLSPEEMDLLRKEQRNWLKYRDDSALEASLKYEGGTQEHLEYVTVLANLTEERCYELVEGYMK